MRIEGDLSVNGLRLHYYRMGGGGPPVVLVHGFTDNALYWTRTAEALAPAWDVVMYDARGHGESDRAGGRFGDRERVDDLVGVIRALGLRRPALVGHSMGAATAALAAAEDPGLARCVVLEDPAWYEAPAGESDQAAEKRLAEGKAYRENWRAWVRGLQEGTREAGLAQIRARSPGWSEVDQNLSLNARRQMELDLFDDYPMIEAPWRAVVARIEPPLLLIIGDDRERGAIVSAEQAREIVTLCRQGQWVQIPGAGHSVRYDQFERYLAALQSFLDKCAD
jgi:pimeloyl-ACP methyl ester carboxylesterase